MRSVAEHLAACLEAVGSQEPLEVLLADSVGCILAEDVSAPFDLPIADLAGCDGYAVRAEDLEGASPTNPVELDVVGDVLAGDVQPTAIIPGAAVRLASGAPVPAGADAVIAIELTDRGDSQVKVLSCPREGENIRRKAEDVRAGEIILSQGDRLGARQVALLAGVGRDRVRAHPRPRVVIVSIGSEIVEPGRPARPGTVFDANGHALSTAVSDEGAATYRVAAVPDEHGALRDTIEDQLVRADLIITTGGLSYGSSDTVKEVLAPLGTVRFDNVGMWPGRQFGVGHVGEDTPIFCLPGDPVSAQVAYEVFVRPAIRKMEGWNTLYRDSVSAQVDRAWYSPSGRREFVRVHLTGSPDSGYQAEVCGPPQALLLSALARSNALAVVPEGVTQVNAGDRLQCMVLGR